MDDPVLLDDMSFVALVSESHQKATRCQRGTLLSTRRSNFFQFHLYLLIKPGHMRKLGHEPHSRDRQGLNGFSLPSDHSSSISASSVTPSLILPSLSGKAGIGFAATSGPES